MDKFHSLESAVLHWAYHRNIIDGATPKDQFLKLCEEVCELGKAINENDRPEILDGIGDCLVVLTILSEQNNINLLEAYQAAYEEIRCRKGKMVNGQFVKD